MKRIILFGLALILVFAVTESCKKKKDGDNNNRCGEQEIKVATIPANGTVGVTVHPYKTISVNADAERIWYEDVAAYGNTSTNCVPGSGVACIGVNNGAGFSWKNTNVYKFGAEWAANEKWTLRAGYAYVTQPIPSSSVSDLLNILAPGVVQSHYTVGLGYRFNPRFMLNPYFMYAPKVTVDGNNQVNSQDISLFMRQYEVGVSLSWKMA